MKEDRLRMKWLVFVFSMGGIASCLLLSFLLINEESTVMLVVFNLLFASLIFPLDGTSTRKAYLLLMGNLIGLFWNYLLFSLAFIGIFYFGEYFKALYIILSPFANLVWIVSFWSMSLANLSNSKNRKLGITVDN